MTTPNPAAPPRYTLQQAARAIGMGERALFAALRKHRVLDERNVPTWRAKHSGHLVEDQRSYRHPTIGTRFYSRPLVTATGLNWLRVMFERDAASETDPAGRAIIRELARLNPDAGGLGVDELRRIVTEARRILAEAETEAPS